MAEDQSSTEEWLVAPDVSPGARLSLGSVIDASQLTPTVLELLGRAMAELQRTAVPEMKADGCPRLQSCGSYNGGCPNLTKCGTYAPPGTPQV